MTKLLVSVRSASESIAALSGGADIIDIKEPSLGSLGRAGQSVWREVVNAVNKRVPISVALGELTEATPPAAADLVGIAFAKIGLAHCRDLVDWRSRWRRLFDHLPTTVRRVAVIYVDESASAPKPNDIIHAACELGCQWLLLDTFDKSRGSIFSHLAPATLERLLRSARDVGLDVAIAGSVTSSMIPQLFELEPQIIAVRGAACEGSRESAISTTRVRQLKTQLSSSTVHAVVPSDTVKTVRLPEGVTDEQCTTVE